MKKVHTYRQLDDRCVTQHFLRQLQFLRDRPKYSEPVDQLNSFHGPALVFASAVDTDYHQHRLKMAAASNVEQSVFVRRARNDCCLE